MALFKTIALGGVAGMALSGCVTDSANTPAVGAPNPASAYCVEQGGCSEIRRTPEGEVGYCHLPDGRVVEEWAFYRAANR